jgi:hypothetical protein
MTCFDITKISCDEISSMIGRYWWSQQDKETQDPLVGWEKLTGSKKDGAWATKTYMPLIWPCLQNKGGVC